MKLFMPYFTTASVASSYIAALCDKAFDNAMHWHFMKPQLLVRSILAHAFLPRTKCFEVCNSLG